MVKVDVLMLRYFLVSSDVGRYSVVTRIITTMAFIVPSFNYIFDPMIAGYDRNNERELLGSSFRTVTRWMVMTVFPVGFLLILLRNEILLVFGQEFMGNQLMLVNIELYSQTTLYWHMVKNISTDLTWVWEFTIKQKIIMLA